MIYQIKGPLIFFRIHRNIMLFLPLTRIQNTLFITIRHLRHS